MALGLMSQPPLPNLVSWAGPLAVFIDKEEHWGPRRRINPPPTTTTTRTEVHSSKLSQLPEALLDVACWL